MNTDLTSIQLVLLAVGSIGAAYSLLIISRARASNGDSKVAHGFFIWPNTISAVITLLVIISILAAGWTSLSWALRMSVMLAVGWAIIFQVFRACRSAGRKLTCDVSSADNAGIQSATGYNLLSASGLFSCSMALFGMVVTLLVLGAAHRDHEAAAVGVLLALTGGFWLAGTFWSFSSALYRGLLAQDTEVSPTDLAYLCVRFRSASGEMAFLAVAGLAAAMAMGIYHYPGNASAGLLFPLGAFGASIVCGILAAPLLKPRTSADTEYKQNRWLFYILGMQVFLAGTGAAAYVLATTLLGDPRAFYTYGIGLLTAMLLILTARYRPPFMNIGSPFGTEIAVAEVLMVIACQLLSFQWLGGYGVALCAVGLLSSFAITFPLGALWAIRTGEDDLGQPIDLPFLAHAASRFTEIVMAGGSFLLVVVFLRLYYESAGLQGVGIDITDAYPLMGLVIGGGFPTLLRTLSLSGHPGLPVGSFDSRILIAVGKWAALRTLGTWLLVVLTPMLIGFFWGVEAPGAFLVGLAAAELFLILSLWLGEVRASADEGTRWATRATHVLVVGTALITVLLSPYLARISAPLAESHKLWPFYGLAVLVVIWGITIVWRKIMMRANRD